MAARPPDCYSSSVICSRIQELLTAITTITFDEAYLTITADVVMLGEMAWAQQLLSDEWYAATLGPFTDGDDYI
jgi:hypothetical protein